MVAVAVATAGLTWSSVVEEVPRNFSAEAEVRGRADFGAALER